MHEFYRSHSFLASDAELGGKGLQGAGLQRGEPWAAGATEAGVRVPWGWPAGSWPGAGGRGEPMGCEQGPATTLCCQGAPWLQFFCFANAHFTFQL